MTNYEKMLEEVRNAGMDKKWAKMFVKKFADDEKAFTMNEEQKQWAMERGFFPGRIELYGLTEDNYQNYLPDWNYFMMHPLNHHFKIWVNDKLTLKYVLNSCGCEESMPKYYVYVENDGKYTYLMDAPTSICKDKDFIKNLLIQEGILAMKPNSGTSGGLGFIKLELKDGVMYENNVVIDEVRFEEILASMRNYIVTEYVKQHDDLARIWPDSECTLRVIMGKGVTKDAYEQAKWFCTVCYARFGSSLSGGASNLSSGGIGIAFDYETGKYKDYAIRYKKFCEDGNVILDQHPDTHVKWSEESLPNWDKVKDMIECICNHVSSLSYLGFDVIVTNEGMKICEINTHPASDYVQVACAPILCNEKAVEFFEAKGMHNFDGKDFYNIYKNCQE